MISTAVCKHSLASGEVRDFIQELHDISGALIEQLQGLHINKHQQKQPIEGLAAGQGELVRLYYHQGRYIQIPPNFVFPTKCSLQDIFFTTI